MKIKPFGKGKGWRLHQGHVLDVLARLPAESVSVCVTSPPYWSLRKYDAEDVVWGGEAGCAHKWGETILGGESYSSELRWAHGDTGRGGGAKTRAANPDAWQKQTPQGAICSRCGAWRGQYGLEPTPELYVEHTIMVLRAIRRVLRKDGVCFLNLGDGYSGSGGTGGATEKQLSNAGSYHGQPAKQGPGLKPKDLILMPERVALAAQQDGWYVRSRIIWCLSGGTKVYAQTQKGEMPMSVREMCRLRPESVRLWSGERWLRAFGWNETEPTESVELLLRNGQRISCTPDHCWPVAERGMDVPTRDLRIGDVLLSARLPEPFNCKAPDGSPDWLGRIVGLYVAEGNFTASGGLRFSLHSKERELTEELRWFAAFYGLPFRVHDYGNTRAVIIDGKLAGALMDVFVAGHGSAGKHLTTGAWQRSNVFLEGVLRGYLDGDGHYDTNNGRWRVGFTRNEVWASDLRCLGARLGASVRLHWAKHRLGDRLFPGFRGEVRFDVQRRRTKDTEIIRVSRSKGRRFFHVGVEEPHVFALASGVLTHNSKPNAMPESVRDRPTNAHETIWMLTKSKTYWWDAEAVREPQAWIGGGGNRNYREWSENGREDLGQGQEPNPAGRNIRDVWVFPTAQTPEAHFATFPLALPLRCIAAACPREVCSACGKARVRLVERVTATPGQSPGYNAGAGRNDGDRAGSWTDSDAQTLGWSDCGCDEADYQPGLVLDPFAGLATTGIAALRLGRRFVGIELSEKYAKDAATKLSIWWKNFRTVESSSTKKHNESLEKRGLTVGSLFDE